MLIRIQMTRKKGGWRKNHPDAVIVARPSKWGNPFKVGQLGVPDRAAAAAAFDLHFRQIGAPFPDGCDITELRGKDLACWCPLDQPCHADVLLKIANEGT